MSYIILKKNCFFGSAKNLEEALALLPTDAEASRAEWFGEGLYRLFSEEGEVQIYLHDTDIDEDGNFITIPQEKWEWIVRPSYHR